MEYKLALELKEAGLGTPIDPGFSRTYENEEKIYGWREPTLEELIEACGPQFEILRLRDKEKEYSEDFFPPHWTWCAESKSFWDLMAFGSTPTEAVARLWLALNKKSAPVAESA